MDPVVFIQLCIFWFFVILVGLTVRAVESISKSIRHRRRCVKDTKEFFKE